MPGRRCTLDQTVRQGQGRHVPLGRGQTASRRRHRLCRRLTPRQPLGRRPLPTSPRPRTRPPPRRPHPRPRLDPHHLALLARPTALRPHQAPRPTTPPEPSCLTQGYSCQTAWSHAIAQSALIRARTPEGLRDGSTQRSGSVPADDDASSGPPSRRDLLKRPMRRASRRTAAHAPATQARQMSPTTTQGTRASGGANQLMPKGASATPTSTSMVEKYGCSNRQLPSLPNGWRRTRRHQRPCSGLWGIGPSIEEERWSIVASVCGGRPFAPIRPPPLDRAGRTGVAVQPPSVLRLPARRRS